MASEEQEVVSGEEREDTSPVAGAGAESDEEASADDDSGFDGSLKKNKRGKKRKQGKYGKEKEKKKRKADSDLSEPEGSGEDEDSNLKPSKSNKGGAMEEAAPSKEESPEAQAMPTVLQVSSSVAMFFLICTHSFYSDL